MIRTCEFVSRCHPDKVCDQIADYLLDRYLDIDPQSRCAIEVMGGHGLITITGEVTSRARFSNPEMNGFVDFVMNDVGYALPNEVRFNIAQQSPEIARGVDKGGAGDQGIMYGYATRETPEMLPLPYKVARQLLNDYQDRDAKSQVTMNHLALSSIVLSVANTHLDKKIEGYGSRVTDFYINPAGDWDMSGFDADTGLTGRKLGVDTYGGLAPHGGGAFSGKDATKVDRSAAYMARYVAKKLLKENDKAQDCLVSVAYAIGVAEPLMLTVSFDGKAQTRSALLLKPYDFRPQAIIERLDLQQPIYYKTAGMGHFTDPSFPWEQD